MKDISVKHSQKTESVDFGPIGRDVILNKKIEDETLRATNRENELEAAIATAGAVKDVKCDGTSIVVSKVADIGPSIDAKVQVETTRATTAEGTLQTNITNEATRATAAETTLTTAISTESTRAQGAEGTLTNNLATEVTNRTNADTTLQTNIDNEATTRANADNELISQISNKADISALMNEGYARETADTAESTTRAAEDTKLSDRIDSLESRGRFLSTWNATTGKPSTYPPIPETETGLTYTYNFRAGDYYIIHNVGTSNKKPTGSSITATRTAIGEPWSWTIGSAEETESVSDNGSYTYDGTNWVLMGAGAAAAWGSIDGNISDQEDLQQKFDEAGQIIGQLYIGVQGLSDTKANKDSVVNLTSAQTIQGTKTFQDGVVVQGSANFTVNIKPTNTFSYNLGDGSYRWMSIYGNKLDLKATSSNSAQVTFQRSDSAYSDRIELTGGNELSTTCSILPLVTDNSLGSSDHKWKDIYSNGIIYIGNECGLRPYDGSKWIIRYNYGNDFADTSLTLCPQSSGNQDLGADFRKWKNLHLSGEIKSSGDAQYKKIQCLTESEYDALTTKDENVLYLIKE